jgi:hypothetical protein
MSSISTTASAYIKRATSAPKLPKVKVGPDLTSMIRQEQKYRRGDKWEGRYTPPTMSEMLKVEQELKTHDKQSFHVKKNSWIDLPRNWQAYPTRLRIRMLKTHRDAAIQDKVGKKIWQQAIDDAELEESIQKEFQAKKLDTEV